MNAIVVKQIKCARQRLSIQYIDHIFQLSTLLYMKCWALIICTAIFVVFYNIHCCSCQGYMKCKTENFNTYWYMLSLVCLLHIPTVLYRELMFDQIQDLAQFVRDGLSHCKEKEGLDLYFKKWLFACWYRCLTCMWNFFNFQKYKYNKCNYDTFKSI